MECVADVEGKPSNHSEESTARSVKCWMDFDKVAAPLFSRLKVIPILTLEKNSLLVGVIRGQLEPLDYTS